MFANLIRGILAAALILAPIAEARACTFDGSLAVGTTYSPTVTTRTFSFGTAQPNDKIILFIAINAETAISFSRPSVVSVSGGGLSWSRRSQTQGSIAGCYSDGTCYVDSEEWVATAAAAIPSTTFTVVANSDLGFANFNIFAIHGTSGFDSNGSLPAVATNFSNSLSTVQITGVSTTQFPDMALFVCNVYVGAYGGLACGYKSGVPPWMMIVGNWQGSIFLNFGVQTQSFQEPLIGAASGITLKPFTDMSAGWIAQGDAVKCLTGGAFPQVEILD